MPLDVHTITAAGKLRRVRDGLLTDPFSPAPPGSRNPFLHPFTSSSYSNLPLATGATFADNPQLRAEPFNGSLWVNSYEYSHSVTQAASSDPLAQIVDIGTGHGLYTETTRVPVSAVIAGGSDKHMQIVDPERNFVYECFATTRISSTRYECHRLKKTSLRGEGGGPQGGVRAFGGSSIAGLIRKWEVSPGHPAYNGRIDHMIAWALRNDQLKKGAGLADRGGTYNGYYGDADTTQQAFPGWGASARGGFMLFGAYQWPATEQDYDSPNSYSDAGTIPMGAMFAIPPSVDVLAMGLTPAGLMLARPMQDFGGYATDRAGTCNPYVEFDGGGGQPVGPAEEWANQLRSNNASDIRKILGACRMVTNSTFATPAGASLTSTARRRPLLPALSP